LLPPDQQLQAITDLQQRNAQLRVIAVGLEPLAAAWATEAATTGESAPALAEAAEDRNRAHTEAWKELAADAAEIVSDLWALAARTDALLVRSREEIREGSVRRTSSERRFARPSKRSSDSAV
jgi:hypothetical protein